MSTATSFDYSVSPKLGSPDQVRVASLWLEKMFPHGIARVLLVTPPDGVAELFRVDTARRRRYPNYPPYGLMLLAQHLRKVGVTPKIINLNHEILKAIHETDRPEQFDFNAVWQDRLAKVLTEFQPDLVGVTCMFTMTHRSLKRVCAEIKRFGYPVAIGGVHVTNDVDRVLGDIVEADIAFLREGEIALRTFCEVVAGRSPVEHLGQVVLRNGDHKLYFQTDYRPEGNDLDVIPAYDLFDVSQLSIYGVIGNFHGFKPAETRFSTVLSNRGCRARCTFCSVRNFNGKAVRQRSVESVLSELQLLCDQGIKHIVWLDDDLLKDESRSIRLFDGMVQRKLDLTWDATNGVIAASCTDEVVDAMARSGCIALNIGVESGNPQILRQIRKPGTVETFLKAAEILRRYPTIHARVFLMIGFPGETLRMIGDTINLARQMDLDWNGITVLQPLPNTPIYDAMVQQGLIQELGSTEVRFNAGGYGKQDEIDLGLRMASASFADAFSSIPLDAIPTPNQLTDIWFFMNYHLNFHRLFTEEREIKLRQQLMNLAALSDVISPEHGFALYFTGYVQYRLGIIDPAIIERLRRQLAKSWYWADRLRAFGLAVEDLENRNFRNKHIPRLLPGQVRDGRHQSSQEPYQESSTTQSPTQSLA